MADEERPGIMRGSSIEDPIFVDTLPNALTAELEKEALDVSEDPATRAIHGGESGQASAIPIHLGNSAGDIQVAYSRFSNPTVEAFEAKFRALEGGAHTIATASGMAAVSQTLLCFLRAGDRLIVHSAMFIGVATLVREFLPNFGIEVDVVDMRDLNNLTRALEKPAKVVYFETVSHPTMEVIEAPAAIAIAKRAGALVVVDNTLLTPCFFQPLRHGADIAIHSATKYIGGHSDALGGVITTREDPLGPWLRKARRILGGVLTPSNAYLLQRGLKTLPLRMERHQANAQLVAAFLEGHPRVATVFYPGLASSPDHARATSFLTAFGGVIGLILAEGGDMRRFADALRICKVKLSFGELCSAVLLPLEGNCIRVSVGLENPDDIVADLDRALAHA